MSGRPPHLKHVATMGLTRARRAARAAGFDDAYCSPTVNGRHVRRRDSVESSASFKGDRIVWPQAPMLAGVTQSLIQRGLETAGVSFEVRPAPLDEVAIFDGAFLCNAATPVCAITAIDDVVFNVDPAMLDRPERAWASQSPQVIVGRDDDEAVSRLGR